MAVRVFSPAKINLALAVTGRRGDGFHDLVSVVAPLAFGDELEAEALAGPGAGCTLRVEGGGADVPSGPENLVRRAAAAFADATGWTGRAALRLTKRIPTGAGLGGGSSNATAALRALNELAGRPADKARLATLAAALGSDCALFLHPGPSVIRGRGELVAPLPDSAARRLRGRRVLVCKPCFGVPTPWAYGRLVARRTDYVPAAEAEARLAAWIAGDAPAEALLANNFEPAVFAKYPALPLLAERLRRDHGLDLRLSGSGSACFALLPDGADAPPVAAAVRACWGDSAFVADTRLAP